MVNCVYDKTNYYERKKTINAPFFLIYIIITILVYILPYSKVTIPYIISGSLMLIFLPFVIFKQKKWFSYCMVLFIFTAFIFILDILLGNYGLTDAINESIRNIRFFIPALWFFYSIKYCNFKHYKILIIFFIFLTFFILIKTLFALENNQWISRILAQGKESDTPEIRFYRLQNIGGFEFSYMIGILTICFVWGAFRSKKLSTKVLLSILAIISYYFIIKTMYTTLLLLTTICLIIMFYFFIKNKGLKLLFIFSMILIIIILPNIFKSLSLVFNDSLLSEKFMNIYYTLTGNGIDSLGSRPILIKNSLNNWLMNPILGGNVINSNSHSFIFSILEKNGLIGLSIFIFLFYQTWKLINFNLKKINIELLLFNICFLYFILLSVLNPIGYVFELSIVTFFITPVFSIIIEKSKYNIYKKRRRDLYV